MRKQHLIASAAATWTHWKDQKGSVVEGSVAVAAAAAAVMTMKMKAENYSMCCLRKDCLQKVGCSDWSYQRDLRTAADCFD